MLIANAHDVLVKESSQLEQYGGRVVHRQDFREPVAETRLRTSHPWAIKENEGLRHQRRPREEDAEEALRENDRNPCSRRHAPVVGGDECSGEDINDKYAERV